MTSFSGPETFPIRQIPAAPEMTCRETIDSLTERLSPLYDPREARAIARVLVSERAGIPVSALLTDPGAELRIEGLEQDAERLAGGFRCNTSSGRPNSTDAGLRYAKGC